jgi:5-hydroxyisourate hydrolase
MSASLSTHVLDTAAGGPAAGVTVELLQGDEQIARTETDGDGRARLADSLTLGRYRLVFHPPSEFFHRVEYELELAADRHYHVPLLVSPFSCASYRGS